MNFSIVTPSFRNSNWLKLCIASVADQGVDLEHIVQDAGSDDGTLDWLTRDPRVRAFVEADAGMYDAVNRGLRRANGDILAYLNCDEQYLPGALRRAGAFFQAHPEAEVVFADAIVVDGDARYLCHRMALRPLKWHSLVSGNLSVLTCATFFRRSVIERGHFFNPVLRSVGDAEWIARLIDAGVPMAVMREFTSVFTEVGSNLGLGPDSAKDRALLRETMPAWACRLRWLFILQHRIRRAIAGHYRSLTPFSYEIYSLAQPTERATFRAEKPTFRWVRKGLAA